jgi:hypothetical protein
MSVKITMKSGETFVTEERFETIQRAMTNKQLLEIIVGGNRRFINPESIESLETPKQETNGLYKQNASMSNFPFQLTPEELAERQAELQPMKRFFDVKADAMRKMKEKEDEVINQAYKSKFGGYFPNEESINAKTEEPAIENPVKAAVLEPVVESVIEKPAVEEVKPVEEPAKKKAGRPKKTA